MEKKPIIVYKSTAYEMGLASTQVPYVIYDCLPLGDRFKEVRYQCLVGNLTFTIFETEEDVIKTYPHVKFRNHEKR